MNTLETPRHVIRSNDDGNVWTAIYTVKETGKRFVVKEAEQAVSGHDESIAVARTVWSGGTSIARVEVGETSLILSDTELRSLALKLMDLATCETPTDAPSL